MLLEQMDQILKSSHLAGVVVSKNVLTVLQPLLPQCKLMRKSIYGQCASLLSLHCLTTMSNWLQSHTSWGHCSILEMTEAPFT